MSQLTDLSSIIAKLEAFVRGLHASIPHANEIEGDLAEIFRDRDDDTIEDFIHDLASYRPGGGDGLYDFERIKPLAMVALKRLRELNGEKT